jgi:hypothetical protein
VPLQAEETNIPAMWLLFFHVASFFSQITRVLGEKSGGWTVGHWFKNRIFKYAFSILQSAKKLYRRT